MRERDVNPAHNTIYTLISDSFLVVKSCGLREEGRRDQEEVLRYGVMMNYIITLESCKFFFTYIIPPIHLSC